MSNCRAGKRCLAWLFALLAIYALCPLFLLHARVAESASETSSSLRVMSFNLWYGLADDGANHWRHRKALVVETVKQFDPDVLGTQELMGLQAEYFEQNLPEYAGHGTSRILTDHYPVTSVLCYPE